MQKKSVVILSVLLLMLAGCSDDDIVSPNYLVGQWEAAHHSNNPNVYDTADMWTFTFNSDGTGTGPIGTRTFRYEINGKRITLHIMNIDAYYGQTAFVYEIESYSKNEMEWEEIPDKYWNNSGYGLHLKFYRK